MSTELQINGRPEAVTAVTIAELLAARGIDSAARGAAVALNGSVVPRRDWESTRLQPGDEVEIVRPYSGG